MDEQQLKRYYTDKEFCELMGVHPHTSARWRDQRLIGFIRTPTGKIRYLQRHIEEFEHRNERKARGKAA